jgi:hypothetical protein
MSALGRYPEIPTGQKKKTNRRKTTAATWGNAGESTRPIVFVFFQFF